MAYILIIDDDEDFSHATAIVLESENYEVRVELNIPSAVKALEQRVPDLIILDVMFPESNSAGIELARDIRRYQNELKNVPILMLTAVNQRFPLGFDPNKIKESWLPVQIFMEKPVDFDKLKQKVFELLKKQPGSSHNA